MASLQEKKSRAPEKPKQSIFHLSDSIGKLLQEVLSTKFLGQNGAYDFTPVCEVSEDVGEYKITVDLPGVTKKQLRVEVDGDQLIIQAERKEERKEEDSKKYVSEISYGSYTRTLTLPEFVDPEKIDAKFEDGVLVVSFAKEDSQEKTQINIH